MIRGGHPGRGFTLVEMLVVLVIVSLIGTLLTQILTHVLGMRVRLQQHTNYLHRDYLVESWFRTTVHSATPGSRRLEASLKGDELSFSGLTLTSLDGDIGRPRRFGWRISAAAAGSVLNYETANGTTWPVARWNSGRVRFRYLDEQGEWHSRWPPVFGRQGNILPRGVMLEIDSPERPLTWFSPIAGRKEPKKKMVLDG